MSFRGYCIKLSDLRSLLKDPPADLVDELRERFPSALGDLPSGPSGGQAVIAYFKSDSEGSLLEMISMVRGVRIESVFFEEIKILGLYEALGAGMGGGVCEQLKAPRLPIPLPTRPDDGGQPWISYLTLKEIEEGLAQPDREDADLDNEILDMRDELRVWLETAREHGADLIVFGE